MAHLVRRTPGGDIVVHDTETGKDAASGFDSWDEAEQWVRENGSGVLPKPEPLNPGSSEAALTNKG